MRNGNIIELEDYLPTIKKHYVDISFSLLENIIKNQHLFLYFKDKSLYVFGEFLSPKVRVFSDKALFKLKKLKKLSVKDIKTINQLCLEIKHLDEESSKLEQDLKNVVSTLDYNKNELRLDISNHCNMHCKYCFQGEKNSQQLPLEQAYKRIDSFVESHHYLEPLKITFGMTSEPFLDLSKIKKIYYYLQEKCLEKIKKDAPKEEIFKFLKIDSEEEYKNIISNPLFYKDVLADIEPRYISQSVSLVLKNNISYLPEEEIEKINEEAIYCAYASSFGKYYLWFCTNGTIALSDLNLRLIQTLFKNDHLGISLDGNFHQSKNRVYNNKELYKRIISNIKLFQKSGIKLEAHCTLNEDNYKVIKLINFYKKLGITKFHFGIEKGIYSEKLIKNISKAYKLSNKKNIDIGGLDSFKSIIDGTGIQLSCYAKKTLCIGPDNLEYFCDYFIPKRSKNLYNNVTVFDREECLSCPFKTICGGTCLALTDSLSIHKDACKLKKALIKQTLFNYF